MDGVVPNDRSAPHLGGCSLPFGFRSESQPVSRHILVSYTDGFGIQYHEPEPSPLLAAARQSRGSAMLDEAEARLRIPRSSAAQTFDRELIADLTRTAGAHYAWLCTLSYRQSIAAHKLVAGG